MGTLEHSTRFIWKRMISIGFELMRNENIARMLGNINFAYGVPPPPNAVIANGL